MRNERALVEKVPKKPATNTCTSGVGTDVISSPSATKRPFELQSGGHETIVGDRVLARRRTCQSTSLVHPTQTCPNSRPQAGPIGLPNGGPTTKYPLGHAPSTRSSAAHLLANATLRCPRCAFPGTTTSKDGPFEIDPECGHHLLPLAVLERGVERFLLRRGPAR